MTIRDQNESKSEKSPPAKNTFLEESAKLKKSEAESSSKSLLNKAIVKMVEKAREKLKKSKDWIDNKVFRKIAEEPDEISVYHFYGMSIASVASTCIYLYYMMTLIVLMYFRKSPLAIPEEVDAKGEKTNAFPSLYILTNG